MRWDYRNRLDGADKFLNNLPLRQVVQVLDADICLSTYRCLGEEIVSLNFLH
jgi:hypothetical protein